ncbi:DMT family transporter [Providencia rettgeri]|uniref:DMT family transporter n=1 Tax=Providencia rettgeri TaxID=587 RepID=UPI00065DD474|nr:DMT family transporter [Providencia rettgeri]ELR5177255.1 DMT family transporter [Providencia rettgeri]
MNSKWIVIGLLSGIFWALDTLLLDKNISKIHIPDYLFILIPLLIALFHDFFSSLWLLLNIQIKNEQKELLYSLKKKNSYIICLAALAGGPIGMSFYILSISYSNASIASTVSTIYPAIGCIIAFIFLKERIKFVNILGIMLVMLSTFYLGLDINSIKNSSLLGFLFALICALGWGLESSICSYALNNNLKYNIALLFRQITSSIIYILIIIIFFGLAEIKEGLSILLNGLFFYLIPISLVGTISYLFYYNAIGFLGPIKAMGLNISYSAWSIILGFTIFNQDFYLTLLFISAIIISGSLLTNINNKKLDTLK